MTNDHIESLRALRALYVEARRQRVADSLRFDCPAGHERRLSDVQSAIQAIDEAIRDEEEHAQTSNVTGDAGGAALASRRNGSVAQAPAATNGWSANGSGLHAADPTDAPIEFAWRSYDAWRSGRKNRPLRNGAGE